jgi:hypothetical protein
LIGSGSILNSETQDRSVNRTAAVTAAVSVIAVVLHFTHNFKAHFLISEQKTATHRKS